MARLKLQSDYFFRYVMCPSVRDASLAKHIPWLAMLLAGLIFFISPSADLGYAFREPNIFMANPNPGGELSGFDYY